MPVYFAKSTQGFYDTDITQYALPADAIEITRIEHRRLIRANERGERIIGDATGKPTTVGVVAAYDANRLSAGVVLTGSGFSNGRYSCDASAVDDIVMNIAYIGATNAFITGRTLSMVLFDNTKVTYTDPDIYVRTMRHVLLYVRDCKAYYAGITKTLPGDTITI